MNEPNINNTNGIVQGPQEAHPLLCSNNRENSSRKQAGPIVTTNHAGEAGEPKKIHHFQKQLQAFSVVSHVPLSIVTTTAGKSETSSLSSSGHASDDSSTGSSYSAVSIRNLVVKKRKATEEPVQFSSTTKHTFKKARSVSESSTDSCFPLSHPSDTHSLSPLHTFIRQQIEVFTATSVELSEPAPGRKCPIQLHQVGLRCAHCKNSSRRVKRAVCYPSSVARVYHSVSDMKGEHFSKCPSLPVNVRDTIQALKDDEAKKKPVSLLTAQHYKRTACALGLRDTGVGAVFLEKDLYLATINKSFKPLPPSPAQVLHRPPRSKLLLMRKREQSLPHSVSAENLQAARLADTPAPTRAHKNCRLLSLGEQDHVHLNGIHCWVRKHIEAFAATEQDVLIPSPGRKQRIFVGQVGIRCIHCTGNSVRVKRAVCYPPSTNNIYHSVSNMKFDHFKLCPLLPLADRIEFEALLDAARNKASAGKGSSNSTAKYYKTAAADIGLIDSEEGMRFQDATTNEQALVHGSQHPTSSTTVGSADDSMDGITALVFAATNPQLRANFTKRKLSVQAVVC